MTTSSSTQAPTVDVQSQLPPVQPEPHAGRRDQCREGHPPALRRRGPALLGSLRVRCRPWAESEGRAHVALRGGRERGDPRGRAWGISVPCGDAGRAHRATRARAPGRRRAEVTVEARFPEHKPAPVSGIETQELYTLHGCAVSTEAGTRRLIGVAAQGMTACPCAQELVAAGARARLGEEGYDPDEIDRILEAVPVATHNQRGLGTLHIGLPEGSDDRARRAYAARDRRAVDVIRDLRADEALG